jgi:hypothetical protein
MIYLLPLFSKSDFESGLDSFSLISTTNDCFEPHSSVLCQGILWKSHHFPVSFLVFLLPFFSCRLDWFSGGWLLGSSLPYFFCCGFVDPNSLFVLVPKFLLNFDNISIGNSSVMRCSENPFRFGCTYAEPHGISEPNSLRVFDTHIGA